MGTIIDPEGMKPLQCSQCESQNIVNPVNEDVVELRCLDCGHEKKRAPSHTFPGGKGMTTYTPPKNPKPYREF